MREKGWLGESHFCEAKERKAKGFCFVDWGKRKWGDFSGDNLRGSAEGLRVVKR